jgi:hypothetical protein
VVDGAAVVVVLAGAVVVGAAVGGATVVGAVVGGATVVGTGTSPRRYGHAHEPVVA